MSVERAAPRPSAGQARSPQKPHFFRLLIRFTPDARQPRLQVVIRPVARPVPAFLVVTADGGGAGGVSGAVNVGGGLPPIALSSRVSAYNCRYGFIGKTGQLCSASDSFQMSVVVFKKNGVGNSVSRPVLMVLTSVVINLLV